MTTKAVIYTRISQDREGTELGVKRQERDCRKLAKDRGWEVVDAYSDDDISASSGKRRPDWERLLKNMAAGKVEAVVAYSSSRLYRRVAQLLPFLDIVKAQNIEVATVTSGNLDVSSADGRMHAQLLAVIDEGQVERMGELIARKELERAEKGLPHGGGKRSYGYHRERDADGKVIPGSPLLIKEDEAEVIRESVKRIIEGQSLTRIIRDLNDRGTTTSQGRRWSKTNLATTIRKPMIAGIRDHKGVRFDGTWPAIISKEDQELASRILAANHSGGTWQGRRPLYVLSGLMTCGVCGGTLYYAKNGTHMNRGESTYVCSVSGGGKGCVRIKAKDAERYVWMEAIDENPPQRGTTLDSQQAKKLASERVGLLERKKLMARMLGLDEIDEQDFRDAVHAINEKLAELDTHLSSMEVKAPGFRKGLKAMFGEDLSVDERRDYLQRATKKIEVFPKEGRERVKITWS